MSSYTRAATKLLLVVLLVCFCGCYAAAQVTIQPKDEIFGGYSWLGISGNADFGVKVQDISTGFDASNVYYLPKLHNLGIIADGSGHFNTGRPDYTGVGFVMGGLQYKYHTNSFSPFVRAMIGAANLSPPYPPTPPRGNNEWQFAAGFGGGFDYQLTHLFTIRVAQIDYIYTNYNIYCTGVVNGACVPTNQTSQWNNVRLAAGVVFNLGNYYAPNPMAVCTAQPTEVTEGEPVTVTATGSNFNPKHTVTYAWTTNAGKIDKADAQSAHIDTTGVVEPNPPNSSPKTVTASATITDPKEKKGGSATCTVNITVNPKQLHPPVVSCSANPATVSVTPTAAETSTITTTASSPDNAQITGYSYTASAGTISGTGTTATLDPKGLTASQPVTVTVTATDSRNLSSSSTCTVNAEYVPPPMCNKINSIAFPDLKRPWRVDNEAKAILDDVASRLKQDPNAKIVIIGYADGEKAPMEGTGKKRHPMNLAAQRAVNAKAYLVQEDGIDPSRVEVRTGTGQSKTADIIWVPQGADENSATSCPQLQNTTPVDESVVKPNQKVWPKGLNPNKPAPAHHHKKAAAKETTPSQ